MAGLSVEQNAALVDELESATRLVDLGVTELHRISSSNDYYHLPMQLLSQGLERLLKVTYALALLRDSGALPHRVDMQQRYRHGILRITDDLVGLATSSRDYMRRPAVQEEIEFITADADLRQLLELLGDFGEAGRYHMLDEFLAPNSIDDENSPYRRWEELEFEVIQREPGWLDRVGNAIDTDQLHRAASVHFAGLIDRFARAIARMWTLGALPEDARRYSGLLRPFLGLHDEQLGEPRTRGGAPA